MYLNIIILISAAIVFIIVARKLPTGWLAERTPKFTWKNTFNLFGKIKDYIAFQKEKRLAKKRQVINLSDEKVEEKVDFKRQEKAVEEVLADKEISYEDKMAKADDLLQRGSVILAEELYRELLEISSTDPKLYNRLGIIALENQKFTEAKEFFTQSLNFGTNNSARLYNLALANIGLEDYKKAKEAVSKAVQLEPGNQKYQDLLEELRNKLK
ncbi:MAG: Tetratricopeptide repeat domain-containing protein [Berkelbacteria bacterium GW2011_GWA2_35_9]|uniref:Tetratricopeptide repeat domain-containing protein n=1 Tax=Berkelbacteria bacterium GW2011_GWA2_35_9 TaxID=1618333 RepID=A0A0G0GB09_9BACT|nr:MAG: Tetratricopeptide repeat domain-containing protein [Berkelbacteria bacterium GW2011_GWA2_35_9]